MYSTIRPMIVATPGIKLWKSKEGLAAQSAGPCDENLEMGEASE